MASLQTFRQKFDWKLQWGWALDWIHFSNGDSNSYSLSGNHSVPGLPCMSFQALPSNSTWPKRNWGSERWVSLSKPTQLMKETQLLAWFISESSEGSRVPFLQRMASNTTSVWSHSWPSSVLGSIYSLRDGCWESQGTGFTVSGQKGLYSQKVLAWPVYCKPLVGESEQVGAHGLAWNSKGERLVFFLKRFPSWARKNTSSLFQRELWTDAGEKFSREFL